MFYKLPEFIRLEQASSPGRGESVDVCVCYPRGGILGGFTSRKIEYVCVCVCEFFPRRSRCGVKVPKKNPPKKKQQRDDSREQREVAYVWVLPEGKEVGIWA